MSESYSYIIGNNKELAFELIGFYNYKQIFILTVSKVLEIIRRKFLDSDYFNRCYSYTRYYNFTAALERTKSYISILWTLYLNTGRLFSIPYFNVSF